MVSRQAKWAKGKMIIFAADKEEHRKLEKAAKKYGIEGKKVTKSFILRDLINTYL